MTRYPLTAAATPTHRLRMASSLCSVAFAIVAVFVLSGCGNGEKADGGQKPKTRPPTLVSVDKVEERELSPRVVVVGTVTAKRTSVVASGANGVVDKYFAEEGQWIKKGDDLSILRMKATNAELEQARALHGVRKEEEKESANYRQEEIQEAKFRMQAAQSDKENAEDRWKRAENAYRRGAVNKEELDEALKRRDSAIALYEAAKQNYERMKSGPRQEKKLQAKFNKEAQGKHVDYLEAEKEKRTTKAPIPGYIVKEHTFVGQWLAKGDPVVTIAQLDEVDVIVNVDQSDIQHVRIGKTADVSVQGFQLVRLTKHDKTTHEGVLKSESATEIELIDESGDAHSFAKSDITSRKNLPLLGDIVQIVPKSDWQSGSRGFPVKVRIRNRFRKVTMKSPTKDAPDVERRVPILKEGMMATVTFQGEGMMAYVVPKDALVRTTDGIKINLFQPSKENAELGKTFQMRVKPGIGDGVWVQVTPDPANPGEPTTISPKSEVVTEGGERLAPVQGNIKAVRKNRKTASSSK